MNCGNQVAENGRKKNCGNGIVEMEGEKICGNGISEIEGKKIVAIDLWQWNCWNRREKKEKKNVPMLLPKWKEKKKKKKNCGNEVAENWRREREREFFELKKYFKFLF